MKTVLVVVAHPDDEVLGCGGAMAWHARQGHHVHLLIMTDGVTSRYYDPDHQCPRLAELKKHRLAIKQRSRECLDAAQILGVGPKHVYLMDLADQRLDQYPLLDITKKVEQVKNKVRPDIVYTHFWNDLNYDHRLVCQAVLTAFRPKIGEKAVDIFYAEVPESTFLSVPLGKKAFVPDHWVDISSVASLKIEALKAYESEARAYPDLRSPEFILKLAKSRGEARNFKYAEAFVKVKR